MDEAPLGNFQGPDAFEFRRHMGCRDAIVLLECCMARMRATQKETYVCYADVRAAFISVSHKATDRSLHAAGASAKTRRIFRAMYRSAQCRIRVTDPRTGEHAHSAPYPWDRGTLQEGSSSPVLFCLLMAHMLQTHEPKKAAEAKRARAARTRCTVCRSLVTAAKPGDSFTAYCSVLHKTESRHSIMSSFGTSHYAAHNETIRYGPFTTDGTAITRKSLQLAPPANCKQRTVSQSHD